MTTTPIGVAAVDRPDRGYTMEEHATDVTGLLDAECIEQARLGGHSFGGLLACYVAATQPDRVERCVVLDAPITVERTAAEGPGVAAHGTVRVLIVDAHELMREGLVRLLSSTDGIEVVGEAAAGEAAVALAATLQPDVVLLDVILPDIDGVEVARRLLAASHPVQILMLTSVSDERRIREAIEVGVIGYQLNDIGRAALVEAIVQAADGRPTLHPTVRNYLLRSVSPSPVPSSSPTLSKRDCDLMHFLALGYSNRAIAQALDLTHGTIKVYVSALLDKLGVSDRTQAALIAARHGLDAQENAALPRPCGH